MTRVILPMLREKQNLTKKHGLRVEITVVKNVDVLLERNLNKARKLIKPDIASIYICL
jgi:hypothetical protein